jgi:hypothetical protein
MPLLYFTAFSRCLNEEDFEEHLTYGAAIEGTTSVAATIAILIGLIANLGEKWLILVACSFVVHVIALLVLSRHVPKILKLCRSTPIEMSTEQVFRGLDNSIKEAQQPAPFSPLITNWQFSGQLVYQNTQRLAIKALICLAAVVSLTIITSIKLS